ncbi:MAG: hypothetical protein LAT64_07170 [Phycisphaerales bacterium]|nr:hypothetical protein [Planctomycetota bacterium]MCH8508536.1 hypothetical protein [Phycisphaerales bacterium]
MKNLMTIVGVLSFVNLLALLGLAGWLLSDGRIDRERILEATAIFGEPAQARTERIEAERKAAQAQPEAEPPTDGDIRDTDLRNRDRIEMTQTDRERLERLRREVRDLQTQLRQQRQMLERDRTEFEREVAEFHAMRDRLYAIDGAEYFRKSLEVFSGMRPADVRPVFTAMIQDGKAEEVISYLAAFDERHRARVMTEFVKGGEVELAADLLESLRTRGLEPVASGVNGG